MEGNVVIQVEEDALSRIDNSIKVSVVRDKFVPHESTKLLAENKANEPKVTETKDKENISKGSYSASSDSGKGGKSRKSQKSGTEKDKTEFIDVKGMDKTESEKDGLEGKESGKKLSVEEDRGVETVDEIEEEILSEASDRTKAEEIMDEEVFDSENEMKEVVELEEDMQEVTSDHDDVIRTESITDELEAYIVGQEKSESEPKTITELNYGQNHEGSESKSASGPNSKSSDPRTEMDLNYGHISGGSEPKTVEELENGDISEQIDSPDKSEPQGDLFVAVYYILSTDSSQNLGCTLALLRVLVHCKQIIDIFTIPYHKSLQCEY